MWLSPGSRIWLAAAPVDMRLGFDGLAAKVQGVLAANPFCGHAFVFRNRRGDRLKLLLWDGLGFWLLYRRLDQGRLHWPRVEDGAVELSAAQWALLVEGRPWAPLPALRMCTPTAL
jgi:transposase